MSSVQCSGWFTCMRSFSLTHHCMSCSVSSQTRPHISTFPSKYVCICSNSVPLVMLGVTALFSIMWFSLERSAVWDDIVYKTAEMLRLFEQIAGSLHKDQGHPEMEATQPEILAHPHRSHFLSLPKHELGVSICSCMSWCSSDNTAWWLITIINCTLIKFTAAYWNGSGDSLFGKTKQSYTL